MLSGRQFVSSASSIASLVLRQTTSQHLFPRSPPVWLYEKDKQSRWKDYSTRLDLRTKHISQLAQVAWFCSGKMDAIEFAIIGGSSLLNSEIFIDLVPVVVMFSMCCRGILFLFIFISFFLSLLVVGY